MVRARRACGRRLANDPWASPVCSLCRRFRSRAGTVGALDTRRLWRGRHPLFQGRDRAVVDHGVVLAGDGGSFVRGGYERGRTRAGSRTYAGRSGVFGSKDPHRVCPRPCSRTVDIPSRRDRYGRAGGAETRWRSSPDVAGSRDLGLAKDRTPRLARIRVLKAAVPVRPARTRALDGETVSSSGPALPGGYDFARTAWFWGLGATGFAYKAPVLLPPPSGRAKAPSPRTCRCEGRPRRPPPDDRRAHQRGRARRTRGARDGVITGERGGISEETTEAFRNSGFSTFSRSLGCTWS